MADLILDQIKNEAFKAKKESVKAKLKKLYEDYNNSVEVTEGIKAQIVELVSTVGENAEETLALLNK